jgi:hypothetical protein
VIIKMSFIKCHFSIVILMPVSFVIFCELANAYLHSFDGSHFQDCLRSGYQLAEIHSEEDQETIL